MKFASSKKWSALALLAPCILGCASVVATPAKIGADMPWTTLEAEDMRTTGKVLGPVYAPQHLETEASHQKCVELTGADQYVEFTAPENANALVIRFHLPDAKQGGGTESALELSVNGQSVRTLALTSHYSLLYGAYPFSNDPSLGVPRNFFDELRVKNVKIAKGDVVRLRKPSGETPATTLDLVDLEQVAPPLAAPTHSLSVLDFGATGLGEADDSEALLKCIAAATAQGKTVWVPPGDYKLTRDVVLSAPVTIQGAGMWYTTFVGDEKLYRHADRRVRFKLAGKNIHLADFAIFGKLNYRNDDEPNDGVVGAGCADSTVSRLWIEHTKVGAWIYNGTRLTIEGCRFRNLLADGVNLCVGTNHSVIQDCTARGAGDDCFAIWPTVSDQGFDGQMPHPGNNVIRHCTGQLPFLANGASVYGGDSNRVEDCLFTDISAGCGILISTTFPTADEKRGIDNNFSGTTVVKNNLLVRCGGFDHSWGWRGSVQICLDRRSLSGLRISQLEIRDSFSSGLSIVAPGRAKGQGTLADTEIDGLVITNPAIGAPGQPALWVREDAGGGMRLVHSKVEGVSNKSPSFQIRTE